MPREGWVSLTVPVHLRDRMEALLARMRDSDYAPAGERRIRGLGAMTYADLIAHLVGEREKKYLAAAASRKRAKARKAKG